MRSTFGEDISSEYLLSVEPARTLEQSAEEIARERDRLRSELDAARAELRLRDETIALVVHDMKNPLAGVISNAEFLTSSAGVVGDVKDCAQDILAASRRLHRLVMSLLDVNMREHGVLTPELQTVELAVLLDQAIGECALTLGDKGLRCTRAGLDAPLRFSADRELMLRLFANLIENAARSSPQDAEIGIAVERHTGSLELRVTDRGPRMSSEQRARVFDAYLPADEALRRARKSRGLGLASCRAIVEAHGGSIRSEDAEPEGSAIRIWLPIVSP